MYKQREMRSRSYLTLHGKYALVPICTVILVTRMSSKYGPMSKSFCKFGLANGSVDDDDATDAVSGSAIDGGELINNLDATISIRFSATGNRIGRLLEAAAGIGVAAVAAAVVVVVVVVAATDDVKFGNR